MFFFVMSQNPSTYPSSSQAEQRTYREPRQVDPCYGPLRRRDRHHQMTVRRQSIEQGQKAQ